MSKKILISFANNDKWYRSQHFLNESAKKYGIDGVVSYNPNNLDKDFIARHPNIFNDDITTKTRGYGYWIWKGMILKQTMNLVDDGDFVIYVDSGNMIINNLDYIFNECDKHDIILFENRDGNYERTTHKNKNWTKRDTFVLMNCDEQRYYDSSQVDGAYGVYKKSDKTMKFINEYLGYCENENIITDIPNITNENLSTFEDHRHDQSILSLMAEKYGIKLYSEPSEWGNYLTDRPYPQLFWHHRGVF